MWNIISGFDTLETEYKYNSQDQVIEYSHLGNGVKVSFSNSYDYAGRLSSVDKFDIPDVPNPELINLAQYSYNENSQLYELIFGGSMRNFYFYDTRGRIVYFQNNDGIFEYTNEYFLNGNVKSQEFSGSYNDNFTNTSDLNFNYKYDLSNRLIESENDNQQYKDHFKLENAYDKDGNILELKRYDGAGSIMDNFNYSYYSGTNKLQRVFGSGTQYTYDANGNMITDEVNRNRDFKYDHRNLITQIRNTKIVIEDSLVYATYYFYDEAGNRIRKKVYQYIGIQPSDSVEAPDIGDIGDMTGYWDLIKDEVYSRDLSGKEVAIYINGEIDQYPLYGLDMIGKIDKDITYYYLKDHLGSVRAVINPESELVSGQDYDAWGYLLQSRQYDSDESVYKFTGKERDEESLYDYFGARYYDARVGRWGMIDPLMEKHFDFSPYNYVLDNPLKLIDPDGRQVLPMSHRPYEMEPGGDLLIIGTMIATAALIKSIFDKNQSGELTYSIPTDEIAIHALSKNKTGKLEGLESQIRNIEEHLDKLQNKNPNDPDPDNSKVVWKAHLIKAAQEAYKDFKQAFRKVKGKDFSKYLEQTFGKERMEKIYENMKKQNLNFKDLIK